MYPRSLWNLDSRASSCCRIAAAASGAILFPAWCGTASSNLSSWRRVRSMKASPSSYVIVGMFSENLSTFDAGIITSLSGCFRSQFARQILATWLIAAKRIKNISKHGGGLVVVGQGGFVCPGCHTQRWYGLVIFPTTCRRLCLRDLGALAMQRGLVCTDYFFCFSGKNGTAISHI
jgi:hypothetical protein